MKKADMAYVISHSEVWEGGSENWLLKHCTKEQLEDLMWQLEDAENDYYDSYYGWG